MMMSMCKMDAVPLFLLVLVIFQSCCCTCAVKQKEPQPTQPQHPREAATSSSSSCSPYCERPQLVREALLQQAHDEDSSTETQGNNNDLNYNNSNNKTATAKTLYYFGLGSNMLRSKVESRSVDGKGPIKVLSMEPAVVKGHRLAFNMRGFPPLEPGMGSLEPTRAGSLHAYHNHECHGALIEVTPDEYERIMASEGVLTTKNNTTNKKSGYAEIVVEAVPYDSSKPPVKAIALRARPHVRMNRDPSPSLRYMNILREGAQALGLKECYQKYLQNHPVQQVSPLMKKLSMNNLVTMFSLSRLLGGWRGMSRLQSHLLFVVYAPGNAPAVQRFLSEICSAMVLMPGALLGWGRRGVLKLLGKEPPAIYTRMVAMLSPPNQKK